MIWPVPGYYTVSSGYSDWRSYGLHGGFDIPAPTVPTVAVSTGLVIFVGWAGSAGRSVYIILEGGYRVHYCHLSAFNVVVGQGVTAGDVVGWVGGSGNGVNNYYGSHLHLNLFAATQPTTGPSHWVSWVGMYAVDPELYLGQEDEMTEAQEQELAQLRTDVNGVTAQVSQMLEALSMLDTQMGFAYPKTKSNAEAINSVNNRLKEALETVRQLVKKMDWVYPKAKSNADAINSVNRRLKLLIEKVRLHLRAS